MKTLDTPCTQKCFSWQRENKQTNMQFWVWELAPCRLDLYLQPVKAVGLLPLTPTLPRPCCWNKAPTVCACSGESAWDNFRPLPPWLRLRPFGQAEVRRESGAGHLLCGGGMMDGVCVGTMPRPAYRLVKRASALPICNADLPSCRLTLGKGASMAGMKRASADGKCHSHFDS